MIIKGASRGGGGQLASYLENQGKNERTALIEIKGTLSQDIRGAMAEMATIADGSRAEKPFYHAQINPEKGEVLTAKEAIKAADMLADKLSLTDNQRIIVEHEKDGRQHFHVVFNRVGVENLKAVNMGNDRAHYHEAARDIAQELGLEVTKSRYLERLEKHSERAIEPPDWEHHRAERLGAKEARAVKAEVMEIKDKSANGKAFAANLEKAGYILAKGEKTRLIIVDEKGYPHNLAKYSGMKAADLRAYMQDVDLSKLPTAEQAKAFAPMLKETAQEQEATQHKEPPKIIHTEKAAKVYTKAAKELQSISRDIGRMSGGEIRVVGRLTDTVGKGAEAAAKVFDKVADVAEAVLNLFAPSMPREISPAEYMANVEARKEYNAQKEAEAERGAALDRMAVEVRKGRTVSAGDIRALNRADLENLKQSGDEGLLQMIADRERDQKRQKERGRERER